MMAWLEKYAIMILGVGIVACAVGLAVQQLKLAAERTSHARDNAAYAVRILKAEQDKGAAEHNYRERSRKAKEDGDAKQAEIDKLAKQAADKQGELATAQRNVAAAQKRIAALTGDNARLHNDLAAYARGGSGDTASACEARAERLAEFVTRGVDLVATCGTELSACVTLAGKSGDLAKGSALDAANFGNQVNTCVAAWPH